MKGSRETPEKVVQVAFQALERGRPSVISGRQNVLMANSVRFVPQGMVARMGERMTRPGHAGKQRSI